MQTLSEEQLRALPVKELNAMVATRVMGYTLWVSPTSPDGKPDCWVTNDHQDPTITIDGWNPAEVLDQAWLVARKVCSLTPKKVMRKMELHAFPAEPTGRTACVMFDKNLADGETLGSWECYDETPSRAICHTALTTLQDASTTPPADQ